MEAMTWLYFLELCSGKITFTSFFWKNVVSELAKTAVYYILSILWSWIEIATTIRNDAPEWISLFKEKSFSAIFWKRFDANIVENWFVWCFFLNIHLMTSRDQQIQKSKIVCVLTFVCCCCLYIYYLIMNIFVLIASKKCLPENLIHSTFSKYLLGTVIILIPSCIKFQKVPSKYPICWLELRACRYLA